MKTLYVTVAAVLLACGGVGLAQAAPQADCLRTANIYDYTPVSGNRALIVTDKARRKFKLTFATRCTGLQYHMGLEFRAFGPGLACMARGDKVVTHDVAGIPECLITAVTAYTPEMEKADAAAAAAAKAGKQ